MVYKINKWKEDNRLLRDSLTTRLIHKVLATLQVPINLITRMLLILRPKVEASQLGTHLIQFRTWGTAHLSPILDHSSTIQLWMQAQTRLKHPFTLHNT